MVEHLIFDTTTICDPIQMQHARLNQTLEKSNLQDKINCLRQRTNGAMKKADHIQNTQKDIKQIASLIKSSHREIKLKRNSNQQKLENIYQEIFFIEENQTLIHQDLNRIKSKRGNIKKQAFLIEEDQRGLDQKLGKIKQKQDGIHQTANVIRQNETMIRKNLKDAALREDKILNKQFIIEQDQSTSRSNIKDIEYARNQMQHKMYLGWKTGKFLENDAQNMLNLNKLFYLIKKIIRLSLWMIKELVSILTNLKGKVKNWCASYQCSFSTYIIQHRVNVVMLAVFAYVMINAIFIN